MVLVYGEDSSEGKMFYKGALQDGISAAVAQQKTVLCFVTNDNEESMTWENEYLQDESISELLEKQAVALRLTAGSDEAGYLAQIFPLPQTPTVVVMKNGELKEYIISGVTKEDFMRRIQKAFSVEPQSPSAAASEPASAQPSRSQPESTPAVNPAATASSENIRRILAERAVRLAAEKEEADRKAEEKRANAQEKAKAKAKADTEAGIESSETKVHKHAEEYKQRRKQANEDRNRILKRIEDDRAERRMRAEERQKERLANQSIGEVAASLVKSPESKLPSITKPGVMTYLQVRLFDGSTIRSRFQTSSSLKGVRKWVDENRTDGKEPYTFKLVLTPLPNRTIDATEEDKTLGALELAPSSTLILIPVEIYSSAYANGSSNIFTELIAKILGFFTWLFGLFGLGGSAPRSESSTEQSETAGSPPDNSRFRGFQNPNDRRRDQQLYNGNSLNFEPRPDDDEKEE